jgi:phytoene dehydrogenase-like protein
VTEELIPGAQVSTVAGWYGMLREEIVRELELERHGLFTFITDPLTVVLFPGQKFSVTRADLSAYNNLGPIASRDLEGWKRWNGEVSAGSQLLRPLLMRPPVPQQQVETLFTEHGFGRLGRAVFREPILDVVSEYLGMPELISLGAAVSPAIPTSPGSIFARLYSGTASTNGRQGVWGMCKGGMGAVTRALHSAASEAGVTIHTGEGIKEICTTENSVRGAITDSGVFVEAEHVISGADPLTTLRLLPQTGVIKELTQDLEQQAQENSFTGLKAHVVLRQLPRLRAPVAAEHQHHGLAILIPELEQLRTLAATAAQQRLPDGNILSLRFTSVTDDVAPAGRQVANISCRAVPCLIDGNGWTKEVRSRVFAYLLTQLDRYYLDFSEHVESWALVTPEDYRDRFGIGSMNGWHIPWSKLFDQRPLPALAHYRAPIRGMYLCGAGMHPGPNVTGAPGYICASEVLRDTDVST